MERMLRNKPKDVQELAESHRSMAESCCQCHRCNGLILAKHFGSMHCGKCARIIAKEMEQTRAEYQAKEAVSASILEARLQTTVDRVSALALRDLMSRISEEHYCAGWLSGLEFTLYGMMHGDSRAFGMGDVSTEDVTQLWTLHQRCGGWWYYDKEHGEMFILTHDWLKMLREKVKS